DFPNLVFLPASQIHEKNALRTKGFQRIIDALKPEYNYIFLDAPAGIGQGLKNIMPVTDSAVVVVTPDRSSVMGADRVIGILENNNISVSDMIVNRYNTSLVKNGIHMSILKINEVLGLNLLGIVPEDNLMVGGINNGVPVVKNRISLAGKAYQNISKRFLGKSVPLLFVFRDGIFSRLMGRMGF
ncbi:MAG: septum site-determining protein MinD, partial [Candidatus Muiribacteriaceae bacterium]